MKLTDGTRTVKIEMKVWQGSGYSEDWSNDFFESGSLEWDDFTNTYKVKDVDYCIDQAKEWEQEEENYTVFVEEVEE